MDELTLVLIVVGPLDSMWVPLSTGECVAGHWLIGGDITLPFMHTIEEDKALMVIMLRVYL